MRTVFTLDCCDREAISGWQRPTALTAATFATWDRERRKPVRLVGQLPVAIEWLSDNGSRYIAGETRALARDIGFVLRTTPIHSPQSNGMAEAFVKTITCDYPRVSRRPDAASVLHQLNCWFEHYNNTHPHKALGYRSRREFPKNFSSRGRPTTRSAP